MTSYKLCLTFFVLAGLSATASALYNPSSNHRRVRRANSDEDRSSESSSTSGADELRAGYRFSDDYFLPEASKAVPKEQKSRENGCERVTKNSMVCMVCKDPKTNEKYEQCSYVAQPKEKGFSYSNSRSHGTPEQKHDESTQENDESDNSGENYESSQTPRADYDKFRTSKPTQASYNYEESASSPSRYAGSSSGEDDKNGHFDYPESQEDKSEYNSYNGNESAEDPAESSDCRQVQKDGQTCTICKDPKTGSDLERCSSSFKPDDKSYSYGKSEKYGFPHSEDEGETYKSHSGEDKSAENPISYESSPSEFHAGYLKSKDDNYRKYHSSEPEEQTENNRESPNYDESSTSGEFSSPTVAAEIKKPKQTENGGNDCREVRKDGEICTVCTDPKTGGNFQKCSYAYQPNDKVYKFTKSKTFGYPGSNGEATAKAKKGNSEHPRESETKQVAASVKAENPCKQIQRDSKTCTVCEDPITGESSEQCAYSYKPKEKHFRFTNSKSSGTPEKNKDTKRRGKESSRDEGQEEESRQIPRWSGKGNRNVKSNEKGAETAETSPCKQVQKDSMTCTVCKDPKTGASSEQCAYSSEPKEKLFTYSKSKSSGNPRKTGNKPEASRRQFIVEAEDDEETKEQQIAESADENPCRQIVKDSMTCTVCKDPKTGANSEQCAYSSEPKKKHFTYTKSNSFGNPHRRSDEGEESRPTPQWADEHDYDSVHKTHGFSNPEWGYDVQHF